MKKLLAALLFLPLLAHAGMTNYFDNVVISKLFATNVYVITAVYSNGVLLATTTYADTTAQNRTNGYPWTNLASALASIAIKATNDDAGSKISTTYATISSSVVTNGYPWTNVASALASIAIKATNDDAGSKISSTYLKANQSIALSGDATGSGTTAITVTATNIQPPTAGSTGYLLTKTATGVGMSNVIAEATITNSLGATIWKNISGNAATATAAAGAAWLTANQSIALSGDATGSGTTAISVTTTNVQSLTNAVGGTFIDFGGGGNCVYHLLTTNASFSWRGFQNFSTTRANHAVIIVTNTSGATISCTAAPAGCYTNGSMTITNLSRFEFTLYGNFATNCNGQNWK